MAKFTYKIEMRGLLQGDEWVQAGHWFGMQRGYATGAYNMLKSVNMFIPHFSAIRLVRSDNKVTELFERVCGVL